MAESRCQRGSGDSELQHSDEQEIQHHIRDARGNDHGKREFRLFRNDEITLEGILRLKRQIEQKALNKLKHPTRARKLRSFLEED